jgi:hypothetical protein
MAHVGGREEPTWSPQLERKYVIRIQCRFPVAKEELLSISTFCQLFVKERSLVVSEVVDGLSIH